MQKKRFDEEYLRGIVEKNMESSKKRKPSERTLCRTARTGVSERERQSNWKGSQQFFFLFLLVGEFTYLAGDADLLRALRHFGCVVLGSVVVISKYGERR